MPSSKVLGVRAAISDVRPQGLVRTARRLAGLAGVVGILAAFPASAAEQEAFPGAEGFGRLASGGRGGRIVEVVNLSDSGPGSLRSCILQTGPRNCVFRVSGVIELNRSLVVDGSAGGKLSILGQTAPGEGITLTVVADATSFKRTPLVIRNTADVVVRYLRVRAQAPSSVDNVDALTVEESHRIYIDHFSASWATDENFNIQGQASDITLAYSILGEGLRRHSKCALLGSGAHGPQNISFWRNLCTSNNDRNPDTNHVAGSCVEIVDNLFYNARSEWAEIFSQKKGGTPISLVGNYFKGGPSTLKDTSAINWNDTDSIEPPRIYASANEVWSPPEKSIAMIADDTKPFLIANPECPLRVPTFGNADRSYAEVLAQAGAFPRDGTDSRLLREVGARDVAGSGKLRIEAGTISKIEPALAYTDSDHDGMADSVEAQFGAVVGKPDAWSRREGGTWTAFESFMEWLAGERQAGRYPW